MVEIALEPFGKEHADDETPEPYYLDLEGEDGEEHDCGSRAETSDAPAESEAESSQHELEVDDLVGRVEQVVAQKGFFPSFRGYLLYSQHVVEGNKIEANSAAEDEHERWIPTLMDLKKSQNVHSSHHA